MIRFFCFFLVNKPKNRINDAYQILKYEQFFKKKNTHTTDNKQYYFTSNLLISTKYFIIPFATEFH